MRLLYQLFLGKEEGVTQNMANDKQSLQSHKNKKGGMNPMVASLAGAAIGAAVGAGAIILSDEKNRKKLESALESLKKQGFNVMEIVQREAENVKKQIGVGESEKPAKKTSKKK
jgi:hypothetical protein